MRLDEIYLNIFLGYLLALHLKRVTDKQFNSKQSIFYSFTQISNIQCCF